MFVKAKPNPSFERDSPEAGCPSILRSPLRSATGRTRSSNRCPSGALLNSRVRQELKYVEFRNN